MEIVCRFRQNSLMKKKWKRCLQMRKQKLIGGNQLSFYFVLLWSVWWFYAVVSSGRQTALQDLVLLVLWMSMCAQILDCLSLSCWLLKKSIKLLIHWTTKKIHEIFYFCVCLLFSFFAYLMYFKFSVLCESSVFFWNSWNVTLKVEVKYINSTQVNFDFTRRFLETYLFIY